MNHVAFSSVSITEDVNILNFLANHITITQSPRLVNHQNRNHTSNNPKSTKSTNAVIFANAANPKNNHAISTYFNISLLLFDFLFCRKIKPANNANRDKAITHKSVLLSTITRNAHIQPVNHNNSMYRHIVIQFQFDNPFSLIVFFHFFNSDSSSTFSFLLFMSVNIWKIIAIQKIRTKVVLILFIEMAILSGDNPNHQLVHPVREKMNVKN
jgi:hypothetical protein